MDQIVGQDRAVGVLQAALRSGRLHHAYVFHGPAGVGKFTTAVAFARVLLCHQPQTDLAGRVVACDACASCRLMPSEQALTGAGVLAIGHPDFHVVVKELAKYSDEKTTRDRKLMNIPVEVLRTALVEPVYRAAQLGHHKVFVVDEAELITPAGQDTLLKTLEEPPAGTFLILVTGQEEKLLPTIRSRCQRVAFVPLTDELVRRWLHQRQPDLAQDKLDWLTRFAAGSPGRALLAQAYDLYAWAQFVLPALEGLRQGRYPPTLGQQMAKGIDDFAKRWVDEHENASKEAANKMAAGLMWALIAQEARRHLVRQAQAGQAGSPAEAQAALGPWVRLIEALSQAEQELAANLNLGLVCDHLVATMARAFGK